MRRPPLRVWIWTAATVALVLVGLLLWRGSDAAATDSTTAAEPELPDGSPSGELAEAWSVTSAVLPERVVEGGRVVVGGERGITALDPVTGEEAWHYARANARLCDLAAIDGVVVAVFRTENRCDEALALDAGTGVRRWTRNVNFVRQVRLSATDRLLLASSSTGIVAMDPTGNGVRWNYQVGEGCRLLDAAAGSTGIAVLQRCADGPLQLRLFDGFTGDEHWTRDVGAAPGVPARLGGAERLVTVAVEDRIEVHAPEGGDVLETYDLPPADGDEETEPLFQVSAGSLVLVWARGELRALDEVTGGELWIRPSVGLPHADRDLQVAPGASSVLVPEADGFVRRDLATGAATERLPVGDGLSGPGRAAVLGPVVVLRLPDRVVAYR